MALTLGHSAYAAVHETGFTKFIHQIFVTRRAYFHFAVPPLGSGVPGVDFQILPPLPVPGTSYGLPYSIDLAEPRIDFPPQNPALALPAPLVLGPNQFSLTVEPIDICILCGMHIPIPPTRQDDRPRHDQPNPGRGGHTPERVCTRLSVWAVGHPTQVTLSPTDSLLGLAVDQIVIKEVCDLEPILECLAKEMVDALLEQVRFTLTRIALGGFPAGLVLAAGPQLADDQLKVWAKIV